MFGRKRSTPELSIENFSSLFSDNVSFVGDLEFEGGLKINGSFKGNIRHKQDCVSLLALSSEGCIEGNVSSYDALIDGTIIGDLYVEHLLELHSNARVSGNISYRQLSMEHGASVDGKLIRLPDDADESNVRALPAPILEVVKF